MAFEKAFTPTTNTAGTGQQQAKLTDTPGEIQRVHLTSTADSILKTEQLESLCPRAQKLGSLPTTSIEGLEKEQKPATLAAGVSRRARSVEVVLENAGRGVEVAGDCSLQRRLEVAKMGNALSRQELSEVKEKLARALDVTRDGGRRGSSVTTHHGKAEAWRSRLSRLVSCPRAASTPRQEAEARFEARLVTFIAASNMASPERATRVFCGHRKSQLKHTREGFGSLSTPDKRIKDARLPAWTLVVVAIAAGTVASLVTARVVAPPPGFGSLERMAKEEAGFDNCSTTYHSLGNLPPSTAGRISLSGALSEGTGYEEHVELSSGPKHENDRDGGGHPDAAIIRYGASLRETVMDDDTCRGIGHADFYSIFNNMCVEAEEMNATGSDAADGNGRREEMTPQILDSERDLKIVNEGWFLERIHGAKDLLLLVVFGVATRRYWQRGYG
ncbi:unnamed protein product [Ectocarpus sp. CCAP 1310/34]|nr:unnamed protein product [Ectocarpus sp. CCAP 1310/34]